MRISIYALLICLATSSQVAMANVSTLNSLLQTSPQKPIKTNVKAKLVMARKLLSDGEYAKANTVITQILRIDSGNAEALRMKEVCGKKLEKLREKAQADYDSALKAGTTAALQDFINLYPGSRLAADARKRLTDFTLWTKYKQQGTKAAYNNYLKESQVQVFSKEALQAISEIEQQEKLETLQLEAARQWNGVKVSKSIADIEHFITQYAETSYADSARTIKTLLIGNKAFGEGDLQKAYEFYSSLANKDYAIFDDEAKRRFDKAKEYHDYEMCIAPAATLGQMRQFLDSHSSESNYYKAVSNVYAVRYAKSLNYLNTSDTQFAYLRSLAYSAKAKQEVETIIQDLKEKKKDYDKSVEEFNKRQRAAARRYWWKQRVSAGWHVLSIDYMKHYLSLGTGLRLRFGKYTDAFNLLINLDYTYTAYVSSEGEYDDTESETIAGQVTPSLGMRFNMGSRGKAGRFFVGCFGEYGARVVEGEIAKSLVSHNTFAVMPEMGFSGKRFDFSIYYKRYIKGHSLYKDFSYMGSVFYNTSEGNDRIGMSVTWFF